MGKFNVNLPVFDGRNEFEVDALGTTSNVIVYRMDSYTDLDNHWAASIASQFRYMGITKDTDLFSPKQPVNKLVVAVLLAKAFDLEATSTMDIVDVPSGSEAYPMLVSVLQHNIMSLDSKNHFYPDKLMPRAAVITAVVRAVERLYPEINKQRFTPVKFPYWDVSKKHWARPYIQKALDWGILTPSSQFRPKDIINKAEYIALLSKTPVVKEKISFIFFDD